MASANLASALSTRLQELTAGWRFHRGDLPSTAGSQFGYVVLSGELYEAGTSASKIRFKIFFSILSEKTSGSK
jgi:hypothetical protein